MLKSKPIVAIALFFSLTVTALAQDVDKIIENHIKATGGREKIQAVKSLKVTGTMSLPAMGVEGEFTRRAKRPNLMRMDFAIQGQEMVQAYDGKTAWHIFPFMGNPDPQLMPEDQAKDIIEGADFDGALYDYKKKGHKIELIGKEDLEGTEAYKLKVDLKNGDTFYSYLDAEYFLELKRITKRKDSSGNEMEIQTEMSDYKPVQGVMMAHAMKILNPMQGTIEIKITDAEPNVAIEDSIFKMPVKKAAQN